MTIYSKNKSIRNFLLFILIFLIIFFSRYPGIFSDTQLNVDESQIAAAAITALNRGFMPWRDFDATTIGPLSVLFLAITNKIGIPITWVSLHVLAALIWTTSSLLTVLIAKNLYGSKGAIFCSFLAVGSSVLTWRLDYLHFTSEIFPNLFLVISAIFISLLIIKERSLRGQIILASLTGFFAGVSLLGKIQALPIALILCLTCSYQIINKKFFRGTILSFTAIAFSLTPILILAFILHLHGQLDLAFTLYYKAGASYALQGERGVLWLCEAIASLQGGRWFLIPFYPFFGLLLSLILISNTRNTSIFSSHKNKLLFITAWFGAALVAILMPQSKFEHHGVFIVFPSILLSTSLVSIIVDNLLYLDRKNILEKMLIERLKIILIIFSILFVISLFSVDIYGYYITKLFILCSVFTLLIFLLIRVETNKFFISCDVSTFVISACLIFWFAIALPNFRNNSFKIIWGGRNILEENVIEFIKSNTNPTDSICIWGWAPQIFHLIPNPNASRHVISHFLIDENSAQKTSRDTFMSDLKASKPILIIDAIAPGFFMWTWSERNRVHSFPELSDFIHNNYNAVKEIKANESAAGVIIYKLK